MCRASARSAIRRGQRPTSASWRRLGGLPAELGAEESSGSAERLLGSCERHPHDPYGAPCPGELRPEEPRNYNVWPGLARSRTPPYPYPIPTVWTTPWPGSATSPGVGERTRHQLRHPSAVRIPLIGCASLRDIDPEHLQAELGSGSGGNGGARDTRARRPRRSSGSASRPWVSIGLRPSYGSKPRWPAGCCFTSA